MMGYKLKDEEIEQIKALDCLRHYYPDIARSAIHIANERKTTPFYGSILKKMGVRKGVPDLFWPKPQDCYHGLWVELKTDKGRLSVEQSKFIFDASNDGYYASVAFGAQQLVDVVTKYFRVPAVQVLE
jgi:hypothetical protein